MGNFTIEYSIIHCEKEKTKCFSCDNSRSLENCKLLNTKPLPEKSKFLFVNKQCFDYFLFHKTTRHGTLKTEGNTVFVRKYNLSLCLDINLKIRVQIME